MVDKTRQVQLFFRFSQPKQHISFGGKAPNTYQFFFYHQAGQGNDRRMSPHLYLWATDQSLRPQTTTASGLDVSKTIFHIFTRHLTTVAKRAWRKIKILKPFSQFQIVGMIPDGQQVILVEIADKIFLRGAFSIVKKMFVGIKQWQAWADFAILTDGNTAAFN